MLLLPAVIFILLNIWILRNLYGLEEYENLISLSYPKGSVSAEAFSRWKESEGSSRTAEAAAWKEGGEELISADSTGRERKAALYQLKGQPAAVFGGGLLRGRYFTEGEGDVCLLDKETVRYLFGSEDVTGLKVQRNGKALRIVGILEEDRPLCIVPAQENTSFDAVTVRKKDSAASSNLVVSMLEAVFGGANAERIDGKLYTVTAWLFYSVVMSVTFALAGVLCFQASKKRCGGTAGSRWLGYCILFFFLEAALLIFLWGVKSAAPGSDYLPSYWSDFDFFSELFKEKSVQVKGLMMHQEFSVWKQMLGMWISAAGGELVVIFCNLMAGVFLKIRMDLEQ